MQTLMLHCELLLQAVYMDISSMTWTVSVTWTLLCEKDSQSLG